MRVARNTFRSGILPGLVLLFLMPVYARAQTFPPQWYEVVATQLTVRNKPKQLVRGTLTKASSTKTADRFYIYFWKPGLTYAWGYADGDGFKGCGWVGVRSEFSSGSGFKKNLVRIDPQPPPPAKCQEYRFIDPRAFARKLPGGSTPKSHVRPYTNYNPKNDGSGATVITPTGLFGNYRQSVPATKLGDLQGGYVRWRYFTPDGKYVMVGVGSSRNRHGRNFGNWGFVRCTNIKPHPADDEDRKRFYAMCK